MATTTNYGWDTPDDTDLVKDGAAAIRTLGSSVDTTTKALNPSTTLGDVEYRSATANTNTRLPIGTAGQVLTVNSGATAPEWAAPAGATNWSLLNAGGTALTGATTVTVSGISGKDKIMILISEASSANASSNISVRLNTDTGSNYYFYGNQIQAPAAYASSFLTQLSESTTSIQLGLISASATSVFGGYVTLTGCNSAGVKAFNGSGGGNAAGSNQQRANNFGGYYNSASTISSISVVSSSGNLDNGSVFVYASA
jgi:hypothetical protein